MKKTILIIGGCGYIGTLLSTKLVDDGFKVICYDSELYGNYIKKNKKIKFIKDDINNFTNYKFKNVDTIVHLANIANDVSVEINPSYSWKINVLFSKLIIEHAIKCKVKNFIYASSGSVYGVKKEKKVSENISLTPISTYNETKMIAERVFLSYQKKIKIFSLRPATVCGYSPRLRLDVSVNALTYQAFKNGKIIVNGGKQIRPNINIQDVVGVFKHVIKNKIKPGIYNIGFENLSIIDIAKKIKKKINSKIIIKPILDIRSYRLDSSKILKTGFRPKFNVDDAIDELLKKFKENKFTSKDINFNILYLSKKFKKDIS